MKRPTPIYGPKPTPDEPKPKPEGKVPEPPPPTPPEPSEEYEGAKGGVLFGGAGSKGGEEGVVVKRIPPPEPEDREKLTLSELTEQIVHETHVARGKERRFTVGIEPTETYEFKLTSPEETERLHFFLTGEVMDWRKGREGRKFIPYSVYVSGKEILERSAITSEQREEGATETLRWIAEHPEDTRFKETGVGYETLPPAQPTDKELSVWEVGDWLKDPLGTLAGGVADILAPIHTRLSEDWMIGPIFKQLTGIGATRAEMWRASRKQWRQRWEKKDVPGMAIGVLTSPLGLIGGSYAFGKGMGALAATKIGQKPLFQIGLFEKEIASSPEWTYQYTFTATPSGLIQAGVAGYLGYETIKGAEEAQKGGKLPEFLGILAFTLPFVFIPYKAGYYSGMSWVQRRAALAKVTDPLQRVQQQALYKGLDVVKKLKEPRYDMPPYDLTRVQMVDPRTAYVLSQYLRSVRGRYIGKAAIGGSTAMDIQMPRGTFRAGGYPKRLIDIAAQRQLTAFQRGLQRGIAPAPLKTTGIPKDIDILLRGFFAREGASSVSLLKSLDIHVHKSLVKSYYGFGAKTLPSTKALVYDPLLDKAFGIKTLSIREQFIRSSVSILPSEQPITGYRSFKDPFTYFDTGRILGLQEGSTKLWATVNQFLYPEGYPIPKVTLGEKFISRIGGAADLKYAINVFGELYPPPSYTPLVSISGYTVATTMQYEPPIVVKGKASMIGEYRPSIIKAYKPSISMYEGYAPRAVPPAGGYPAPKKEGVVYLTPIHSILTPPLPTKQKPGFISSTSKYLSYEATPYPPPIPPYRQRYEPEPPTDYYDEYSYKGFVVFPQQLKPKYIRIGPSPRPKKEGQGFNVLVRERRFFKGTEVGEGKFIQINKVPLTEIDALSLGGTATDKSAARTFKIVKTSGKPKPLSIDVTPWNFIQSKFVHKKDRFIEQDFAAIDTPEEVEGISALGWIAERRKQQRIPKIRKQKPMKARTVHDEFMFDLDEFERIFKRLGHGF